MTIVGFCKTEKISSVIRGGTHTIGLRMPNHEIPLAILQEIGVPIIGTSANFHGKPTPYTFEDLDQDLLKKVDIVIQGVCSIKQASTVIDCTTVPWKILRQGATILDSRFMKYDS